MQRRSFIKAACASAAAGVMSPAVGASTSSVSGRVTKTGGGGLLGVIVTNGRDSVLTDAEGRYELPVYDGMRFVSVCPPSGFRCEWFYHPYPHRFTRYDFQLVPWSAGAGEGCSFVQIADSEICRNDVWQRPWIDHVKRQADAANAAFIVHTGDICRRAGLISHSQAMNDYSMGRPMVYCIGNHDMESGDYGEELFESIYGPCWRSFEAGGVHFVVTPMDFGDYRPGYTMDRVADWVRGDLALVKPGMPVVFFNHMISNYRGPAAEVGVTFGDKRKIRLDELCNLTGFVYGHVHCNSFRRSGKDGRTAFVSTACPNQGGIGIEPISVRVCRLDKKGRLTSRLSYGTDDDWPAKSASARWEAKLPASVLFSAPVVHDGRVFVGVSDDEGNATGAVVALDAATGNVLWKFAAEGSVRNRVVCVDGCVVAQDTRGTVYALDEKTGASVWRRPGSGHAWQVVFSGLVAAGHVVIAGTPTCLAAFEARTGREVWREIGNRRRIGEPCSDVPAVADGILVFASNWRGLYGYDVRTGKELWFREDGGLKFPGATPAIRNGKVFYPCGKGVQELDLRTGKTLRSLKLGVNVQVPACPLFHEGVWYLGSAARGIVAVDDKSFRCVRDYLPGLSATPFAPYTGTGRRCVGSSPLLTADGKLVAAAPDGKIHFWDRASGREMRSLDTGAPYLAGATIADGRIYAADLAGYVRSFEI